MTENYKGICYNEAKNSITMHLHGTQYATIYFLPKSILEASIDFWDSKNAKKEFMQNNQSLDKIAKSEF